MVKSIKNIVMISIATLLILGCTNNIAGSDETAEQKLLKDDWVFDVNDTVEEIQPYVRKSVSTKSMVTGAAPIMMESVAMSTGLAQDSIGFSVGGAKDSNNFYDNINSGYLPKINSLTYEGIFYKYYFDTAKQEECQTLFCPTYTKAIANDPFTKKERYYLTVGLNSGIKEFKRKPLNLVVVLDISGSMGSPFDQYYYDKNGKKITNEETSRSKMEIANRAIVDMMSHLKKEDRFGVVLFDDQGYLAKPLNKVADTDIEAIKKHILEVQDKGGTNWSAGYKKGVELFETLKKEERVLANYENRIIFLTDAMPNRGELAKEGLFDMSRQASNQNIFTTFVGIGVDFNVDLVEYVNKTTGGNYFAIHSNKEFKKCMNEAFDFWVSPLVFDLSLSLKSKDYKIAGVYGNPTADKETGELIKIHSLFPSKSSAEGVKGGVILVELEKTGDQDPNIALQVSYRDRENNLDVNKEQIVFDEDKAFFENRGIQKAIVLKNFVSLAKAWVAEERRVCNDKVDYFVQPYPLHRGCVELDPVIFPPKMINTWERKSCQLKVAPSYQKLFSVFNSYFEREMAVLNDATLKEELEVIQGLLTPREKDKVDGLWEKKKE
jgi:Ca-activated chloride channel family protein